MAQLSRIAALFTLLASCACWVPSCADPEPGEVSFQITHTGQLRACNILVFNDKGNQIQEEHSDQYGVAYVKGLPPGNYTFKFKGMGGEMFPAVASATVTSGGSEFVKVELTQAGNPSAGAAAGA